MIAMRRTEGEEVVVESLKAAGVVWCAKLDEENYSKLSTLNRSYLSLA
jgi:hypothetical protein